MAMAIQLSAHRGCCVLFDKPLTQPASSDPGELITECFLFHVSDSALCTGGHLVRHGAVLLVSCRAGDGARLLPATDVRILTGGLMTCDWLRPVTREVWLVSPPITTVFYFDCSGWVMCTWITCANRRSVDVLLLTWTHVLLIILFCLTDLYFRLWWTCWTVPDCVPILQGRLYQPARDSQRVVHRICTFTVYISYCVMASGDVWPAGNRSGVAFECEFRTSWNPPKVYVNLNSPGVVVLDTNVVPDVIGLHAFHDQAALVRVLPGHSNNIVRVLIPDDRAVLQGFHDLLINDLSDTKVLPASAGDLTVLRQHWLHDDKASDRHGGPTLGV